MGKKLNKLRLLDGWDSRLHTAIEAAKAKPFQWGAHDCALFAADCVLATTGTDMAEGLRGTYDNLQGAAAAMKRIVKQDLGSRASGGAENSTGNLVEPLVEHMAAKHGAREVKPAFAQRHAICLYDDPGLGPALGVCLGHVAAFLHPDAGIVYVPMRRIRRAWVVG